MIRRLFVWVRELFGKKEPVKALGPGPEARVESAASARKERIEETPIAAHSDRAEGLGPRASVPETADVQVADKLREHKTVQEKNRMSRIVKAGLIQTSLAAPTNEPIEKIR